MELAVGYDARRTFQPVDVTLKLFERLGVCRSCFGGGTAGRVQTANGGC
jgi:hypothetical protein